MPETRTHEWPRQTGKMFLAAALLVLVSQCHRNLQPASVIQISDASTASQLTSGFYNLEDGKWRWTGQKFAVSLAPPAGSDAKGANLRLDLYIPDSQIASLGPMTLSAETESLKLEPETFTKGGQYSYTRAIPPASLRSNIVPVLFTFDKAVQPIAADGRQLGAVVTQVGLQTQ